MDKPIAQSMAIVIPAYRMHSQLFNNMLADIREEDTQKRIEDRTNHFTWMVGNLVNCRYWLAEVLGLSETDPNEHLFKDAKALDMTLDYPTLAALKEQWHGISPLLYQKLITVDEPELNQAYAFGMGAPYVEENKRNMVGMFLDHESYLVGQLGLMRKVLGYEGVRYDLDDQLAY